MQTLRVPGGSKHRRAVEQVCSIDDREKRCEHVEPRAINVWVSLVLLRTWVMMVMIMMVVILMMMVMVVEMVVMMIMMTMMVMVMVMVV
eukprot:3257540-Pleurochrysis_carterae.AAC.1